MNTIKTSVLLTGASSGIGEKIANMLLEENYFVYGISRTCNISFAHKSSFCPVIQDLEEEEETLRKVKEIRKTAIQEGRPVRILINNAGTAYYGLHEELNSQKIREMIRTNLEIPMLLSQLFMRDFKKMGAKLLLAEQTSMKNDFLQPEGAGNYETEEVWPSIITIASVTAVSSGNPHGACYGATKAGLLSFSRSLFEEARKYGVRVTAILPDMTDTGLYRHADFQADNSFGASLDPEDVAESVRYVLRQPGGVVIPELMIRPQLHRIRRKAAH